MYLLNNKLARAYGTWQARSADLNEQKAVLRKGVMRLVQGKMAAALGRWKQFAEDKFSNNQALRRGVMRLVLGKMAAAFATWKQWASATGLRTDGMRKAVMKMMRRQLAAGFTKWKEVAQALKSRQQKKDADKAADKARGGLDKRNYFLANGDQMDLMALFKIVQEHGGYEKVAATGVWKTLLGYLGLSCSVEAVQELYYLFVLPYEDEWMMLSIEDQSFVKGQKTWANRVVTASMELPEIDKVVAGIFDHRVDLGAPDLTEIQLSRRRLSKQLKLATSPPKPEEVDKAFDAMDTNQDGMVDRNEFHAAALNMNSINATIGNLSVVGNSSKRG